MSQKKGRPFLPNIVSIALLANVLRLTSIKDGVLSTIEFTIHHSYFGTLNTYKILESFMLDGENKKPITVSIEGSLLRSISFQEGQFFFDTNDKAESSRVLLTKNLVPTIPVDWVNYELHDEIKLELISE